MSKINIGEKVKIIFNLTSFGKNNADFNHACNEAKKYALHKFGADDCGNLKKVENHRRSRDSLVIEFITVRMYGGMDGWSSKFEFSAWVERCDD